MDSESLALLKYIASKNDYNEYSEGHQYNRGDIVTSSGVQYISIINKNLGSNPELLKNWIKVC
jgi:hypothetical protein